MANFYCRVFWLYSVIFLFFSRYFSCSKENADRLECKVCQSNASSHVPCKNMTPRKSGAAIPAYHSAFSELGYSGFPLETAPLQGAEMAFRGESIIHFMEMKPINYVIHDSWVEPPVLGVQLLFSWPAWSIWLALVWYWMLDQIILPWTLLLMFACPCHCPMWCTSCGPSLSYGEYGFRSHWSPVMEIIQEGHMILPSPLCPPNSPVK